MSDNNVSNNVYKWYILNTPPNQEQLAVREINKIITKNPEDYGIKQVILPTRRVLKTKNEKKVEVQEKMFPSYVFVEMCLNSDGYADLKNLSQFRYFLGGNVKPIPVSEDEMKKIFDQISSDSAVVDSNLFYIGQVVEVIAGPFRSFTGMIQDIDNEKKKLKIVISIFERQTMVELMFSEVKSDIEK